MALRFARPDFRSTYFQIVGPLKIYCWPTAAKMEGWCHRCSWSQFSEDERWLRRVILWHLWDRHDPIPKPISKDVMPPPGW